MTVGLALLAVPGLTAAVCGDGLPDGGEQCDPGPDAPDDCCTAGCQITSAAPAFVCRPVADLCDAAETCDGVNAACPADSAASAFVQCRAAGDECDPAENCDGVNTACPADQTEPDGTACDSGDGDGDNVCDASDNCPVDANPEQVDVDTDTIGNVCDPDEGPLNPIRITFKLNTVPNPRDNSALKARGDFVTLAVGDVFDASGPITLTLRDGKSPPGTPTIRTHTFLPSVCLATPKRVRCVDGDYRISFSTSPSRPGVWRFKSQFKKQSLTGPLQGPATGTLTYGPATDRNGSVEDCKSKFSGMTCKDFR
jgi:hypothetical protein